MLPDDLQEIVIDYLGSTPDQTDRAQQRSCECTPYEVEQCFKIHVYCSVLFVMSVVMVLTST